MYGTLFQVVDATNRSWRRWLQLVLRVKHRLEDVVLEGGVCGAQAVVAAAVSGAVTATEASPAASSTAEWLLLLPAGDHKAPVGQKPPRRHLGLVVAVERGLVPHGETQAARKILRRRERRKSRKVTRKLDWPHLVVQSRGRGRAVAPHREEVVLAWRRWVEEGVHPSILGRRRVPLDDGALVGISPGKQHLSTTYVWPLHTSCMHIITYRYSLQKAPLFRNLKKVDILISKQTQVFFHFLQVLQK